MLKHRFTHPLVAVLVLVSLLVQGTWVLAGTTGAYSGTVTDQRTGSGVGNALVTITSPSQTVTTHTDGGGHFTFASLAPDTYTLSVQKQGYDPLSQSGITVQADQEQTGTFQVHPPLRTIVRVLSRGATNLVQPGTTSDVYAVNATQQDKFSGVGGGGGLNNAYSAIATVPGVYVPSNQMGYFQTISIRGGDYDQVGYEVDGIPVNRSFDNYPSGNASSLGQQELQVYTGAAPANAEGQGLSGFINQVVRTGTFPGFADVDLGIGSPAFYHKASFEVGGASPNRNFSYYLGLGGYDQDFQYVDHGNGQAEQPWGPIIAGGPVSNIITTPIDIGLTSNLIDRDTVANVHFGIPHHHDGSKDDIQLLYLNSFLQTAFFSSPNDVGNANLAAAAAYPATEVDGFQYLGAPGTFLPGNFASLVVPYYFPHSGTGRAPDAPIPVNNRDTYQNDQAMFKLQYQKNFSSNAYFRIYGYTNYSDWLQNGQDFTYYTYVVGQVQDSVSADYNLFSHSRGLSGTFADQINAQNLIQLQGSFTTASTVRDNNTSFETGLTGFPQQNFATVVNANAPTNGYCYTVAAGTAPVAANCNPYATTHSTYLSLANPTAGYLPVSGMTCGTGPCAWYVTEDGQFATYNTVKPNFTAASLTDTFKPNDKLVINAGLRLDDYQFVGSNTTGTPARTLFFNSFNLNDCVAAGVVSVNPTPGAPCPAGSTATNLQNIPSQVFTYPVFEPRLGATYSLSPDSVLRASYGRYSQAPNAAFEQYNSLQQNLPHLLGSAFYKYGFTTPGHDVQPEESNNYDVSLEHHFRGTDMSFKLTPFYRYTQNQIQEFFLDQASGFVSGLNADRLTSRGVEFQFNKGDFGRDGLAAQLSFTYTNAYAKYDTFANGNTVFSGINTDIQTYNGYTSFCGVHPADKRCTGSTTNAVPCFTATGTPDPTCAAGSIANPYYNAPVQPLVNVNGEYAPFSLVTGPIGASANSYLVPYVAQLIFNWKKGPFAFTPSLGFSGGNRYGVPETSPGIDPAAGCAPLAGATSVTGDPRYPYGAPGGVPYDATTCAGTLNAIPNPFTHQFDPIGSFVEPNNVTANLQMSYQASKNVTFVATFANIINNCFGGSKEAWTTGGSNVCSYGLVDDGNSFPFVGNTYNPGQSISPVVSEPYERSYGVFNTNSSSIKLPFQFYRDARLKV